MKEINLDRATGNGWARVKRRWQRYKILDVSLPLPRRWVMDVTYSPRFDLRPGPSRLVISVGLWKRDHLDRPGTVKAILFQRYTTGYELSPHTDLDGTNQIVWVLLKRARSGGELTVEGPVRSWLWGRIRAFDGGRQMHGFSKITAGTRVSLIFQAGRYEPRAE